MCHLKFETELEIVSAKNKTHLEGTAPHPLPKPTHPHTKMVFWTFGQPTLVPSNQKEKKEEKKHKRHTDVERGELPVSLRRVNTVAATKNTMEIATQKC